MFEVEQSRCGTRILRVTHGRDARATISEVGQRALLQSRHASQQELSGRTVAAIAFNGVVGDPTAQLQKTLTHCLCVDDVVRRQGSGMWGISELWTTL